MSPEDNRTPEQRRYDRDASMWRLANAIGRHLQSEPNCNCCLHLRREDPGSVA